MADSAATGEFLPLHVSLSGRRVVVVGGGPVAARKTASLLTAGAEVLVIAPVACNQIAAAAAAGLLIWRQRAYLAGDLDGAWLAVAATGHRVTDEAVEREAKAQRTFCVRADRATAGTARMPAVLRRHDLVVSVGSGDPTSADPKRVVGVRNAIARLFDTGALPLQRYRLGPGVAAPFGR